MALKCNERLRRSTARQRGGESKHRKARDATEKHSAAKRRKGLAIPGDARRWRGDKTLCDETRRLCFAQLCHATAKSGTDAQRSSKAVNGGGVARQSDSPRSGGDEIGKRPARAPCGTGAWTRACRKPEGAGRRTGQRAVTATRAARVRPAQHRGRTVVRAANQAFSAPVQPKS